MIPTTESNGDTFAGRGVVASTRAHLAFFVPAPGPARHHFRYLEEETLSSQGGGAAFPGDDWLEALKENMDYSVQTDRSLADAESSGCMLSVR